MPEKLPHKRVLGEEEFGRLFNKCRIPFTTVANSYVHDAAVAEDLVNDSFVRLWEKRNEILTENFEAYLFQIVIRKCLDFLRSEQTQTKIRQDIHHATSRLLMHELNSLESCAPGRLYASEVAALFRDCMDRMPDITREVFLANRFGNKTYQEIAEELGLSVRRVTTEMQTALQLLRRTLKDYLPLALMLLLHR